MCRATLFEENIPNGISDILSNIESEAFDADLTSLSTLAGENMSNLARYMELASGPQTDETRAEIASISRLHVGIDERLGEIEGRIVALRGVLEREGRM